MSGKKPPIVTRKTKNGKKISTQLPQMTQLPQTPQISQIHSLLSHPQLEQNARNAQRARNVRNAQIARNARKSRKFNFNAPTSPSVPATLSVPTSPSVPTSSIVYSPRPLGRHNIHHSLFKGNFSGKKLIGQPNTIVLPPSAYNPIPPEIKEKMLTIQHGIDDLKTYESIIEKMEYEGLKHTPRWKELYDVYYDLSELIGKLSSDVEQFNKILHSQHKSNVNSYHRRRHQRTR
jgi:hypothetical protein